MLSYGSGKRAPSNECSSKQFNKYIDRMNALHPTETPQYPGHMSAMKPKDAMRAQLEQQALMQLHQQQVMEQALMQQQVLSNIKPGPPNGFIGVSGYSPYKRPKY